MDLGLDINNTAMNLSGGKGGFVLECRRKYQRELSENSETHAIKENVKNIEFFW